MKVTSPVFYEDSLIPVRFTCDGENLSPPLVLQDVPTAAKSLCLVMNDPDAPGGAFTHWIVYNLPATLTELEEGVSFDGFFSGFVKEGINSFGRPGYGGPCPPRGAGDHHYYFHFYALDCELELPENIDRGMVMEAIRKNLLDEAVLMGRFGR